MLFCAYFAFTLNKLEEEMLELTVTEAQNKMRLDKFLADGVGEELSRERIKSLIKSGAVYSLGDAEMEADARRKFSPSHKISSFETYVIEIPDAVEAEIEAEDIPLDVLYEDADVIVINKPAGISVHPSSSEPCGTLVNALLFHCKDLSGIGGVERPGIVHRLDKGTSGVMIVAKNDKAHASLAKQFSERTIERFYLAICYGAPIAAERTIDTNIGRHPKDRKKMAVVEEGGKHAITTYEPVEYYGHVSALLRFKLHTGRTHQIRVHAQHLGYPLLGDPMYLGRPRGLGATELHEEAAKLTHQMLHAEVLGFVHPSTGEFMKFESSPPEDMQSMINALRKEYKK